ncbi:MAG: 3-deoxy-D-manno-octulosonic acid transferase [Burkholderiales bacterium]
MKRWLALAAYDGLMHLLAPLLWLRFKRRAKAEPLYGEHLNERFARYRSVSSGRRLWVHAVSLGETRAAAPLLQALRAQRPGLRILLTHGTATGREAGRALLREGDRQCWLPIDTAAAARRFLLHHRPVLGVLMETEVWPNLLREAERLGVPMLLANARLSPKSLVKARRLNALLRPAVQRIGQVLAQTEADAERFRSAGAADVRVLGNLKFDLTPDAALLARGAVWHGGLDRPVVLAAVWRDGEDQPLLDAWRAMLLERGQRGEGAEPSKRPLLVIVPRHPQRFDEVAALIQAAGFSLARRSAWGEHQPDAAAQAADVWLGDSMREMPAYYALADVVLLGGSFAPLGGQNLIEPAACGRVVVMGPHTFNFAEAAALAETAGAARRVADLPAAVLEALRLLTSPERAALQQAATTFAGAHRGAAERLAQAVLVQLDAERSGWSTAL